MNPNASTLNPTDGVGIPQAEAETRMRTSKSSGAGFAHQGLHIFGFANQGVGFAHQDVEVIEGFFRAPLQSELELLREDDLRERRPST